MDRAYSVIQLKSIDDERRLILGTATTPSPDRLGDVIEPLGVAYQNPLPLLLYHDTTAPVGQVTFDRPTKAGITFTARLPRVEEPGRLKERVDEAWQSIKAGLIRGVSIGFRVLDGAVESMRTGGSRFLETEVLELSLVVVPANADATISAIKSYDVDRPAAPGPAAGVPFTAPASRDQSHGRTMKGISEKLTVKKAELRTKSDQLAALDQASDEAVLSDAQQQESATLTKELASLRAEVERLTELEKAIAIEAEPVKPAVRHEPARTPQVEVKSTLPPGIEFARYVACLMATKGQPVAALQLAKERFPDYPRIHALLKTAVTPHTSTDGSQTGGQELVYAQNLVGEFIEYLRPRTIIGQFGAGNIPSLRRVPFNVRITGQTSGGTAGWVGQGVLKPVTKFDFSSVTLNWAKVAAITVLSDELARFSNPAAEGLIRDALASTIIARVDTDFVDPDKAAVSNVSPASITNGLVAGTPSGTDAAAVRADLATALQTYIDANIDPNSLVIVTSNTVALTLSLMRNSLGQQEFPGITMRGGMLEGFPVITSQYCAHGSPVTNMLIFVNAGDIFLADDGQVSIDASREASVEMETDPANQSGTVVSMWQANLIALRAERYINWAKRRADAVYYFDSVAYSSGSPA